MQCAQAAQPTHLRSSCALLDQRRARSGDSRPRLRWREWVALLQPNAPTFVRGRSIKSPAACLESLAAGTPGGLSRDAAELTRERRSRPVSGVPAGELGAASLGRGTAEEAVSTAAVESTDLFSDELGAKSSIVRIKSEQESDSFSCPTERARLRLRVIAPLSAPRVRDRRRRKEAVAVSGRPLSLASSVDMPREATKKKSIPKRKKKRNQRAQKKTKIT